MNIVLDPVWPWSRVWEVLSQLPVALGLFALVLALAGVLLPGLGLHARTRRGRAVVVALLVPLAFFLLLLARQSWAFAFADAADAVGSGVSGYLLAALWLVGMFLLLVGPGTLAGLSVASYLDTPGISRRRLVFVAGLRLLAFAFVLFALARPAAFAVQRDEADSELLIVVDRSRSMTIQDEQDKSRWELALASLKSARPLLERLRNEQRMETRLYSFGDKVDLLDLEQAGAPDDKRTDLGGALRTLFEQRVGRTPLRGLLLISDGQDNGSTPVLEEAARWRGGSAGPAGPLSTFACGNPTTTVKQNDVAVTSISTAPTPFVPLKGKLTVKVLVDARGYENVKSRVRLFLESVDDKGELVDREVLAKDEFLPLTTGNEVTLTTDAPARPGEVKVKVVIETPKADNIPLNNVIETFVTVSREGISVLLVDRQRAWEPQSICDALSQDPRIRVTPIWVRGGRPLQGGGKFFPLDDQPFDVIILGDVTVGQLQSLDDAFLSKLQKQVQRGAGLMAIGGYVNLGNGDWGDSAVLTDLLPVDLRTKGQRERPTPMQPTDDGVRRARYLFRLEDKDDVKDTWKRLAKLDGCTLLGLKAKRGTETVLATTDTEDQPLLVMDLYGGKGAGKGAGLSRVLVFGGDTTYRWIRDPEGQRLHSRFWRQLVVWLARQEDAEGSVWIKPDVRRLPVRSEVGFQVGLRSKGGGPDIRDGTYEVEAIDPDGTKRRVAVSRGANETRGTFPHTQKPGVYKLVVRGQGKSPSGEAVSGESSARVILYEEDVEMTRAAANPELMQKIAAAGGGEALRVEQLAEFLARLAEQPLDRGRERREFRPDWKTTEQSPFLIVLFVLFCGVVSLEWGLRRWWGLV